MGQLQSLEQKPGTAAALAAALAPKWTYFYVLPATHQGDWHDVYQQRLDRDDAAAERVEEAIRCLLKTKDKGLKVEVATARVDLWNEAYKHEGGTRISRAKKCVGDAWVPENKRFLVRISEAHSKELVASPCSTIIVENVPRLDLVKLQDTKKKSTTVNPARMDSISPITKNSVTKKLLLRKQTAETLCFHSARHSYSASRPLSRPRFCPPDYLT